MVKSAFPCLLAFILPGSCLLFIQEFVTVTWQKQQKTPSGKGDEEAEFAINFKTLLPIKLRDRQAERKRNNKTLDAKIKKSKHSPLHRGGVNRQTLSYSLPHLKYSLA